MAKYIAPIYKVHQVTQGIDAHKDISDANIYVYMYIYNYTWV